MSVIRNQESTYIETPRGLFTSGGYWFHITSEALNRYAPGLLEKHSLEKLLKQSEVWIRSSDNLGIMLFMTLLYTQSPVSALVLTFVLMPLWHMYKSSFISSLFTRVLILLDKEFIVVLYSVFVLSWLGIHEQYSSVFIGIAGFCFLKFGWFRATADWAHGMRSKEALLLNDRVLKMLILHYAVKEDIPVAETRAMEQEILNLIHKQKEVVNKYKKRYRSRNRDIKGR